MQELGNRKPWVIASLTCLAIATVASFTFALSARHEASLLKAQVDELTTQVETESESARNAANMLVAMFETMRPSEPVGRVIAPEEILERAKVRLAESGDDPELERQVERLSRSLVEAGAPTDRD